MGFLFDTYYSSCIFERVLFRYEGVCLWFFLGGVVMTSEFDTSDFAKDRLLTIVNGPGEFDVAISLFRATRVKFSFEHDGSDWNKCPFIFCEMSAFERRFKVYKFKGYFPKGPTRVSDPIGQLVCGIFVLTTRRGILELTTEQVEEWNRFRLMS